MYHLSAGCQGRSLLRGRRPPRLMRRAVILLVAGLLTGACGDDSPSAPSPVTRMLTGNWTGTLTSTLTGGTWSQSTVCLLDWNVTSDTGGVIAGTWTLDRPSDTPSPVCAPQTGPLTGRVSPTGALSELTLGRLLELSSACVRLSGTSTFNGTATTAAVAAESRQRVSCSALSPEPIDSLAVMSLIRR